MERHLSDGGVYTVHWAASLEKEGKSTGAYGSVGLSSPDPQDFIPYDSLTQDEVLNWVFESLGPDGIVSIQESLNNQVEAQLHPTDASGVPW